MCGIAGKIDLVRPVDPQLLERMCDSLVHRGPDARGLHVDGGVGLGVQRLAVIDLHTGDQPIYNEDRSVVVVLNGEIYNYIELREILRARGHSFRTATDTETIVHLYEEFGSACVEHLRGMFSFAIWDASRRKLLLARDRVGEKPMFFRVSQTAFWFASELRAMLQDPEVPRAVDYDAIDSYLRFQYVPHPMSAFKGVRKLPPAHVLEWTGEAPRLSRYWSLDYRTTEVLSMQDAAVIVRESLLEATKLRLRSDVPVGAFLSGGVDSSSVVAAMARSGCGSLKTFSIGFDEQAYDETAYAKEVAQHYDTDHHEFRVEPKAISVLPRLVWHYGEPFADSTALATFYLAELARKHVTVALTGEGGDESFAGYNRYLDGVLAEQMPGAPGARRALAAAARALGEGHDARSERSSGLRALEAIALSRPREYDRWMSFFTREELDELYEPGVARELPGVPSAQSLIIEAWLGSRAQSTVEVMLDVDVQTYLPGDLLVKIDIATMAHSLEARAPFVDHVLMQHAAHLAGDLKLNGPRHKAVLKEAMRPWLPASVLDRPKMGFEVPVAAWLRGGLAHLPDDILVDPVARARGIFRPERVRQLIDEHRDGTRDNGRRLWALLQLELWFRSYIDGPEPEVITL